MTEGIWADLLAPVPSCPRPMLAQALRDSDLRKLSYPLMGSAKIDGYRCLVWQGRAYARSGKLHPCKALQTWASKLPQGLALDGELIVPGLPFNQAGGLLRRVDYTGPFQYLVFDLLQDGLCAADRYKMLEARASELPPEAKLVKQFDLKNPEEVLAFERGCLQEGYEGIVLRKPGAQYKHGRGTLRDQIMLKLKRFKSAEALVLGVEPRMYNSNPQERTPLGYAERSTAKDGLLPTNVLGKLHVKGLNGPFAGKLFDIGNFDGLGDEEKIQLLASPPLGQICTYKYFPEGVLDKPRHPVWLCWRPDWDLETFPAQQGESDDKITKD